jgi:hypothetical protein
MGRLFGNTAMKEQAITVGPEEIVIMGQFFIHKDYSITRKDVLLDVLAKQYSGQRITIRLWDGENTDFSGFETFMKYVCNQVGIPYSDVTFESHSPSIADFNSIQLKLGIFISVNQYLPATFNQDLSNAKFVGSLLGRYNASRLRLAYELDTAFPADTFITFQPDANFIQTQLDHFSEQYPDELAWIKNKVFDRDLISRHYMGMINWQDACRSYGNVWNQYQIEVVSETDSVSDFWFTEKTANCLATGKPFVLVSGQYSLHRLREMGFQTFHSVIDESYDSEPNPYRRIARLTSALKELYTSSSKAEQLQELYRLASQNIELYRKYSER